MRPQTRNRALLIAYERGRSAARMGLSIAVCPFTITNKHRPGMQQVYVTYWHRGWDDGKAEFDPFNHARHSTNIRPNEK